MSMRTYIEFAKKAFQSNLVYRVDYVIGIISTLISIFVYIAIWKAIYLNKGDFNGITLSMVITNFILAQAISSTFSLDDFIIANKVNNGTITTDLLKPINFNLYILSQNIGNIVFKIIMHFIPTLILSITFIGILPPYSIGSFVISLVSIILGFFVLYNISFIISILSFWFYNIWSLSTIKNVIISVLSGTIMPLWFMPQGLLNFIKLTPFDTIYFIPISIYLGKVSTRDIFFCISKQVIWLLILSILAQILWKSGIKKLVLQGG